MTQLKSASGLSCEFNANGSLRRFDHGQISLLLFIGNELEGGPANIYLRKLIDGTEDRVAAWTPLLGPRSPTRFDIAPETGFIGSGTWQELEYSIALVLAPDAPVWFWRVTLKNASALSQSVDLTYAQDLALAPYGAVRMNEFYVSQYIDHTPLLHAQQGVVIASRQNQAADGKYPWSLIGSIRNGVTFATDALQLHGLAPRGDEEPTGVAGPLPNKRLQHEHSMAVIRDSAIRLEPGETTTAGFFGHFVPDHPAATTPADLARVSETMALAESALARSALAQSELAPSTGAQAAGAFAPAPADCLFSTRRALATFDLDDRALRALFDSPWRHEERDEQGNDLSFFYGDERHVVLRAKEMRTLRPHGHLLRTGLHLTPDESGLTSTTWMGGVFHSMITQGHVSINRIISTVHGYIDLFRSHGVRVFAELDGDWQLLALPSAYEMSPTSCRWIYQHKGGRIDVEARACNAPQALELSIAVRVGSPARFLVSHHIALNGDDGSSNGPALWKRDDTSIRITPPPDSDVGRRFPQGYFSIEPGVGTGLELVGGDELLFADGQSRQQPFVCVITEASVAADFSMRAHLIDEEPNAAIRVDSLADLAPSLTLPSFDPGQASEDLARVLRLADIVPWFSHNALVHYLSPRGLEQYSGGGWGTRDVCQGPVELLLALGRVEPVRDLLLRVVRQQNADGDWPQWFMFFDRERNIRPGDSHGDIVFWPLVVLAQYLLASGDAGLLEERVPFFDAASAEAGEQATVWEHAQRALALIEKRVVPGTALAAYGHGDWNDSLQPADPSLREHLCSAWTVTLNFQTLGMLARACRSIGRAADAAGFESRTEAIRRDFQRLLVVDGVLTGYALFETDGTVRYLLHPRDETTGAHFSSLAMIHAILEDLLTPAQIRDHLGLIDAHLRASDGVRLFDCPMHYHGGPQTIFQRAETATFFGREIGLMYMHAHLRYAQAMAHIGEPERFFEALCQANPIEIRKLVPNAMLRQANCYYSSSDASFADRYQASAEYHRVPEGSIPLEGGWRVYSSGAGIALGLIVRHFLGLSQEADWLIVDPVIPHTLDGLSVSTTLFAKPVRVIYTIGAAGCGVTTISLNEQRISFVHDENPHRRGSARCALSALQPLMTNEVNVLKISLGT